MQTCCKRKKCKSCVRETGIAFQTTQKLLQWNAQQLQESTKWLVGNATRALWEEGEISARGKVQENAKMSAMGRESIAGERRYRCEETHNYPEGKKYCKRMQSF